ncbi:hypothetical protein SAMN04490182_2091 [Pseudomonas cedrina]|uniref:Uncharacterized protein n=2 Tax=Pseudomonas cedrina TaxID=651740 RepID=A0A1V2K1M6_PSECE|nr:DUF6338 family protein [Pseudomonas cedrina]ONH50996.1 hypothetical protein BLL36_24100 [Pseudomonas cedrina subsp. cedrina]SDS66933.1 hypothetical protein SAMN04490182_2091 [Pseudomonas cedrina]
MDEISKELLPALQLFLPGFLSMTIFYWFAEVPKTSQFERVIQALICTTFITMCVEVIQQVALLVGQSYLIGTWTTVTANLYALGLAVALGSLLAHGSNHDWIYALARKFGLTSRSSTPETVHLFKTYGGDGVVLHMLDERRLMGYLVSFPSHESSGLYLVEEPHWLLPGKPVPERIIGSGFLMVNSVDVRWVEFLKEGKS